MNVCWSQSKVPVILVRFEGNLNFLGRDSENAQMSDFMKIRPMGAELFYADRKTRDETVFAFRNFANTPEISFNIPFFVIIPSSDNFSLIMRVVHITMILLCTSAI